MNGGVDGGLNGKVNAWSELSKRLSYLGAKAWPSPLAGGYAAPRGSRGAADQREAEPYLTRTLAT